MPDFVLYCFSKVLASVQNFFSSLCFFSLEFHNPLVLSLLKEIPNANSWEYE